MEELIKRAKYGDKEAFENLIMPLNKDLYRVAKIRINNDEDIYDALQETVLIAFTSIKNLNTPQYFKTWLIKILINECNKIYRQKNKKKIISFEEVKNQNIKDSFNTENIEDSIDFYNICKELKYEEKIIIVLYYKEKFTDEEIGKILNKKRSTVTTKRMRAKEKIKNNLELGGKIND